VPRLSEFYGIAVYMYWNDHEPAHFHAIYAGDEALVRIDDGVLLAGSLPRTAGRLVQEWRLLHREELAADWQRARAFEPLTPIEGLR
jgi:hypothetical protein